MELETIELKCEKCKEEIKDYERYLYEIEDKDYCTKCYKKEKKICKRCKKSYSGFTCKRRGECEDRFHTLAKFFNIKLKKMIEYINCEICDKRVRKYKDKKKCYNCSLFGFKKRNNFQEHIIYNNQNESNTGNNI